MGNIDESLRLMLTSRRLFPSHFKSSLNCFCEIIVGVHSTICCKSVYATIQQLSG